MKKYVILFIILFSLFSCNINNDEWSTKNITSKKTDNTLIIKNDLDEKAWAYSNLLLVNKLYNLNNEFDDMLKFKCSSIKWLLEKNKCLYMKYSLVKYFKKDCSILPYKKEESSCIQIDNRLNGKLTFNCSDIVDLKERWACEKVKKITKCSDLTNKRDIESCNKYWLK